jgi:hypothetical protein
MYYLLTQILTIVWLCKYRLQLLKTFSRIYCGHYFLQYKIITAIQSFTLHLPTYVYSILQKEVPDFFVTEVLFDNNNQPLQRPAQSPSPQQ